MHTNHKILLHSAKTQSLKIRMNKRKDQKPAWFLAFSYVVELRGVEPLSESTLTGPSPGAGQFQHSLPAQALARLSSSVES